MILTLPLSNVPEKFDISLSDVNYILVSRWNDADEGGWIIDFYNENESPILMNVPLVTGDNLLGQYEYVGIAGDIYVFTDGDDFAVPTIDNLGNGADVYFEPFVWTNYSI